MSKYKFNVHHVSLLCMYMYFTPPQFYPANLQNSIAICKNVFSAGGKGSVDAGLVA